MSDRELLELAAKAAGYKVRWHERWECFVHAEAHNVDNPPTMAGQRHVWSPLTDDGDALRLAVKLRLKIQITDHGAAARLGFTNLSLVALDEATDVEAATRAAIVRAAAEIGRAMP